MGKSRQVRPNQSNPHRAAIMGALAAAGLTATIAQLVLMRELVAVFYGTELVLGLILAAWLAWVAVGAWAFSRFGPPAKQGEKRASPRGPDAPQGQPHLPSPLSCRAPPLPSPPPCGGPHLPSPPPCGGPHLPSPPPCGGDGEGALLATILITATILLPIQIILVRTVRSLLGMTPGALVPFGPMMLAIALLLAPLCLLLGAMFTLGARLLAREETGPRHRGPGSAYVAESLGAVLGGALFSLLLVRWLDPFQVTLLLGALNLALAGILLALPGILLARIAGQALVGRALALGAVLLALLALPLGARLHAGTLGWQYPGLRLARDSVYGRIVVTGSGEQRVFYENGLFLFETQGEAAEEVAHLPLLAHPQPRRVLIIGGGVSGTLGEVLRHPPVEEAVYVELDPVIVEVARAELPPDQAAVLDDGRVTLVHEDGRRAIRALSQGDPFDVIIVDLPEPSTGQLNRFYTAEFFAGAREVLADGGILSLGLPWQENYPGPALQRLAGSIYGTLAAEFPDPLPLPGGRLLLLASDPPPPSDPALYRQRLAERTLDTQWLVPSTVDHMLGQDRVTQARDLLTSALGARPNRDLEPVSTYYALSAWLSRFSGTWSRMAARASLLKLGWLALALALMVLAARFVAARLGPAGVLKVGVPLAVGLAGLASMTLQVVLLLAFQVVHGYVYSQVGLLVTASMGGLALGSALANRRQWPTSSSPLGLPSHGGDRGGASSSPLPPHPLKGPERSPRLALAWTLGATGLFGLGLALLVGARAPAWAFPLLALAGGGLTGLVFPTAIACLRSQKEEPGRLAARLYGADLAGACLGAVLASVLLVPVLGIPQTCLAVGLVGLAGVVLLL